MVCFLSVYCLSVAMWDLWCVYWLYLLCVGYIVTNWLCGLSDVSITVSFLWCVYWLCGLCGVYIAVWFYGVSIGYVFL